MPYHPRAPFSLACAHCGLVFEAKHLGRKYCSTPCKSLATQARKQTRQPDLVAQLAAAEAELARVQAALAARPPSTASSPPPPRPVRPRVVIAAFKAPVTAQTLLRQAKRQAGAIRVTEIERELGPVYVAGTDPHTHLQQHVAAKRLWWRHTTLDATPEWVHTTTFWVGTDERIWVEAPQQGFVIIEEVRTSPPPRSSLVPPTPFR